VKKKDFINSEEEKEIIKAIQQAERNTSGEIRVHIEDHCEEKMETRVQDLFFRLEMHKTKERNAVLIYISANDHQFYIFGDKGIHQKTPPDFWQETIELMLSYFKKSDFVNGLIKGILKAGEQLKIHFPSHHEDENELPDEISRS